MIMFIAVIIGSAFVTSVSAYNLVLYKVGGATSGTITGTVNCGLDCGDTYPSINPGTSVTLRATASPGHSFTGWGGACYGTGTCQFTMNADKYVQATFSSTASTYALSISKSGGGGGGVVTSSPAGINCGTTCTASFATGTFVSIFGSSTPGVTFEGWSDCTTNGQPATTALCEIIGYRYTVSMVSDTYLTAYFSGTPLITYSLTVSKTGTGSGTVSGTGISCGTDCSEPYNSGTLVTLTPYTSTGSSFTGWTGACSGTGTCTITIDAAKSVTANFNLITYSLTVIKAGTGAGTISSSPAGINSCGSTCSYPFNQNTNVILTPTTSPGSSFSGWTGACSGTGTCTVTMDAAKSVTATFIPIVNGTCGTKNTTYPSTTASWPSGSTYCLSGDANPLNVLFPPEGGWTSWICQGSGGGLSPLCTAAKTATVFNCNLSSPSGAGIILYPGTATQSDQNWIYDDTSPYSSCSWRCNSSNNYIRDGNSCIQCLASETNCANGINDDCLNGWDYDIQTWSNGAAIGSPYHTQGDPNCKVGIITGTITGGIAP